MFKKAILVFLVFLAGIVSDAGGQNLPLGSWREHLPFSQAKFVANTPTRMYCATEEALFYVDKSDNSIQRYSKINGLSDVGIVFMDYNSTEEVVIICYENSNIDLVYSDKIVNVSDLKRRTATGDKTIFDVTFNGKSAYLSTGFGILVLDLEKAEIKDTYVVGLTGNEVPVYSVATDGVSLFASMPDGILKGDLSNPNLNNFSQWTLMYADVNTSTTYNKLSYFNNKLVVNITSSSNDTTRILNSSDFSFVVNLQPGSSKTKRIKSFNDRFYIVKYDNITELDNSLQLQTRHIGASTNFVGIDLYDVTSGDGNNIYIADKNNGLVKYTDDNNVSFILPNSPYSGKVSALHHSGKALFATHGINRWTDGYDHDGYSYFNGTEWKSVNQKTVAGTGFNIDDMMNAQSVVTDPSNPDRVFIGSRIIGVYEFENGVPKNAYNSTNSSLLMAIGNNPQVKIGGMDFDNEGNLWVVNSGVYSPLNKLMPDGTWSAINLQSVIPNVMNNLFFGDVLCDSYGQVWLSTVNNGMLVYDINTKKAARVSQETGGLNVNDVRAVVEDKEGQLWIGTSEGVVVMYSPGNATGETPVQAQKILITINGVTQYLLDKEIITAIAVDGANRKWIGTKNGGVFLLSPDGTKQLLNFNTDNSPLFSNAITAIAIDPKTGEVFFGTEKGLISYVGDASDGETTCNDLVVFPNPVKETYTGSIAIRGVTANGNVKITDIAGNVVYQTTANGGIAIWNGNNFDGKRAQTGVYLVFATDEKGDNTCTTKLLLVN